jgi:hypothetical protein
MEKTPAGYIVYWMSKSSDPRHGMYTPTYKANMKCVKDYDAGVKLLETLFDARDAGKCYGSRLVHHVGGIHQLGEVK